MSVKLFGSTTLAGPATLIGEIQVALSNGEISSWADLDMETRAQLIELSGRLRRIQAFGGMYSQIELSPEVEALLCDAEEYADTSQSSVLVN